MTRLSFQVYRASLPFIVLCLSAFYPVQLISAQSKVDGENGIIEQDEPKELQCYSCMRMDDNETTKEVDTSFFMSVFANTQFVLTKCKPDEKKSPSTMGQVIAELDLENRTHVKPWLWMTPAVLANPSEFNTTEFRPYCMTLEFKYKSARVIATTFHYLSSNFSHKKGQNETCLEMNELGPHKVLADEYIHDGLNGTTILSKLTDLNINVSYSACFCNQTGCNNKFKSDACNAQFTLSIIIISLSILYAIPTYFGNI